MGQKHGKADFRPNEAKPKQGATEELQIHGATSGTLTVVHTYKMKPTQQQSPLVNGEANAVNDIPSIDGITEEHSPQSGTQLDSAGAGESISPPSSHGSPVHGPNGTVTPSKREKSESPVKNKQNRPKSMLKRIFPLRSALHKKNAPQKVTKSASVGDGDRSVLKPTSEDHKEEVNAEAEEDTNAVATTLVDEAITSALAHEEETASHSSASIYSPPSYETPVKEPESPMQDTTPQDITQHAVGQAEEEPTSAEACEDVTTSAEQPSPISPDEVQPDESRSPVMFDTTVTTVQSDQRTPEDMQEAPTAEQGESEDSGDSVTHKDNDHLAECGDEDQSTRERQESEEVSPAVDSNNTNAEPTPPIEMPSPPGTDLSPDSEGHQQSSGHERADDMGEPCASAGANSSGYGDD